MTNTPDLSPQIIAALRAQRDWARRPVSNRLRPVRAFRLLLVEAADDLCAAVHAELGRPPVEVLGSDVLPLADACRFLEREAAALLKPRKVRLRSRPLWLWGQRDTIHRRPHGLVAIIGTWNYPFFLNGVQITQALTAGNAVLWKPSEVSTHSAPLLHSLLLRAGYPADLVPMLPATREMGAAVVEADIDHVVFTGSAATGRELATRLGERLVSSTLELSGCDAMFVLPDADVNLAARAAWFGSTINRGQTCIAVRRAFVHRAVYSAFVESLEKQLAAAGPMQLAMEGQVRQAERLVTDATARGGRVLTPPISQLAPGDSPGANCLPHVIADATPDMAVCREDCFAPLMAVLPFDEVPDALRKNDKCRYGLGSSIFTKDKQVAAEIAEHLRTGMVAINDVIAPTAHPATSFGGRGLSGWGVTQGPDGVLGMTVPQVVSDCGGSFHLHYNPQGEPDGPMGQLLTGFLQWCHAPTVGRRWKGLWRLVRAGRKVIRNDNGQ
jgi:acyl-CoA reductase-like NAD-dependent aldehyde dehydrogenase